MVASRKILAKRGEKSVHETRGGSGREYITILCCGSAIGEKLVPYIVYKGKNLMTNHTQGGPSGTRYSMSDSGWMETANFHEWFVKVFLPATADMRKTGPAILFFDGHQSHDSITLIEQARENNVILYVFPPHTTHLLQPLDVGVFGPFKTAWAQVLKKYKLETLAAKVDRQTFPSLISKIWDKVLLPEHLIGGFRKSGIHPLSREAIPDSALKISASFTSEKPGEQSSASTTGKQPASTTTTTPQPGTSDQPAQPTTIKPTNPQESTSLTPVTIKVASYFGALFAEKNSSDKTRLGKRGRTQPRHYGEALTEEEVFERIKEEEAAKKRKKEEKKKTSKGKGKKSTKKSGKEKGSEDENTCQGCGGHYDSDDEEIQQTWIGCDKRGCWRWYHFGCGGQLDMPDPKLKWFCPSCTQH